MIEVDRLTKMFGQQAAVQDASFEVEKGAVLGFLGPNGAGKSTTMRILTCFLRPTLGRVVVGGHDVTKDTLAVRRLIGYLPESNPLYLEMKVAEYLKYRAGLKGVESSRRRAIVSELMARCGLADVERKVIGNLSRGFRQRVGLADALLHDPQVLILDEPTVGLDPNQIKQVREMIRDLAEKRTVILSTHILQEVDAVCDQVIIIDKGRIVLKDSLEGLRKGIAASARCRVEIRSSGRDVAESLRSIPAVATVEEQSGDEFSVYLLDAKGGEDLREAIYRKTVERGWTLRDLRMQTRSLEDIFAEITLGKAGMGS
ncbi:MAG: ATP-binding cassette domain-containing protein [Planctomycetota bacterium]|nr:ATP-binding cassette domain-containing protein [Planctomycetota bacterium]